MLLCGVVGMCMWGEQFNNIFSKQRNTAPA